MYPVYWTSVEGIYFESYKPKISTIVITISLYFRLINLRFSRHNNYLKIYFPSSPPEFKVDAYFTDRESYR